MVAVALLIENTSALRLARVMATTTPRPTARSYAAPAHLREGEGVVLAVDPALVLESTADIINLILILGTGTLPPNPVNIRFTAPGLRPVTMRFTAPFTLTPRLAPALTDLTISAPGIPGGTIAGRLNRAAGVVTAAERLRVTLAIGDPGGAFQGVVYWGVTFHMDFVPSIAGGAFFWTIAESVVDESHSFVSPWLWVLAAAAAVATVVTAGIASGSAVATGGLIAAAIFAAVFAGVWFAQVVGYAVLQSVVSTGLSRSITLIPSLAGPGGIPPLGTTLVPPEIIGLLPGPVTFRRVAFDDLVVGGSLPPPDAAVHLQARDLSAAAGEAFDLDAVRVVAGVSADHIPLGADLLWWNAAGALALQNGPATGVAVVRADSLLAIRESDLASLPFLAGLWLDRGSVPPFDSPPPADTRDFPVRPLFLGVRTSEGRLAKCAVWRDASDRLHVQAVTYATQLPHLAVSQSRIATRGEEIDRGWSPVVRAEYVRYSAAWRFGFRANWSRLQAPVTFTWFVNDREVRTRASFFLPSTAWMTAEVADGELSVSTPMGEPASIEVRAEARDTFGLELIETVSLATDGTVTHYGESDIAWVQRQFRALAPLESLPYRLPLDLGDPAEAAAAITRPYELALSDAVQAGMGFSVDDARAFAGLAPIDDGRT